MSIGNVALDAGESSTLSIDASARSGTTTYGNFSYFCRLSVGVLSLAGAYWRN